MTDMSNNRQILYKEHQNIYLRERAISPVVSYPPRSITVAVSGYCPNHCIFCPYHGKDFKASSNLYNMKFNMNMEEFTHIVDVSYNGYIPRLKICSSGEPFMNPDIIEMIDYAGKKYKNLEIQTSFPKKIFEKHNYIEKIVSISKKIGCIYTDILSGIPEQHNEIKTGSSYEYILESVSYLLRHTQIQIGIVFIATKDNYNTLSLLLSALPLEKHKQIFIQVIDVIEYDHNDFTSPQNEKQKIHKYILDVKESNRHVKIIAPPIPPVVYHGCRLFWQKIHTKPVIGIEPKNMCGSVVPKACPAFMFGGLKSIGNLLETDNVMDVWNSDTIVSIRNDIVHGVLPDAYCSTCKDYGRR